MGAVKTQNGVEFSLYSGKAHDVALLLYEPNAQKEKAKIALKKDPNSIWKTEVLAPSPETEYLFEVDGQLVMDPYAKALSISHEWNTPYPKPPRCQLTFDHTFDWQNVAPPHHAKEDLIIYEMHVRGFTMDPSSQVAKPGTYLGVIEKIPHLKNLGITAVELMPIHEFDETDAVHPGLFNYWGYSTLNFFCPKKRYATSNDRLAALTEFKTLVRELHRNGIEVILDVVYNHVSSKSQLDLIDKDTYFILYKGEHTNYTGCGNTINANHDPVMNLIISSLRHFATECHVDGFRFDLGGALARAPSGEVLKYPPLFRYMEEDKALAQVKFIGEPWDCVGHNLMGKFPMIKLSEWNSTFKMITRRFIKGDAWEEGPFRDALLGSPNYFSPEKRTPLSGVNYVTSHDGFTLRDLVSYNSKHNEANGEESRDGENNNYSWNCGVEGKTSRVDINEFRDQQMRNLIMANMLALGIPMMLMGDEYGLTHDGNNNTYCHDGPITWFDWYRARANKRMTDFVHKVIAIRKEHQIFRQVNYFPDHDVKTIFMKDRMVAFVLADKYLIAFNAGQNYTFLDGYEPKSWEVLLATTSLPEEKFFLLPPRSALIACRR